MIIKQLSWRPTKWKQIVLGIIYQIFAYIKYLPNVSSQRFSLYVILKVAYFKVLH